MKSFRDITGEEWTLPSVTLAQALEIESYDFQGKCDPIQLVPPQEDLFTERLRDTKTCFGIVWVLVRNDGRNRTWKNPAFNPSLPVSDANPERVKVLDELQFAQRFDGACLAAMKVALWEELPAFFPEAMTSLRALTERYSKIQEIASQRLQEEVKTRLSDKVITEMIDDALSKIAD